MAGAPARQRFALYLPGSAGGEPTNLVLLHDDSTSTVRVTNPGRRSSEAYNVSMRDPGRLSLGQYVIECDNTDGRLSQYAADTIWDDGGYLADPKECLLKHQLYVLVAGAWSEITGIAYTGRIVDVLHDVAAQTCQIITAGLVNSYLEAPWTIDDGETFDTHLDVNV